MKLLSERIKIIRMEIMFKEFTLYLNPAGKASPSAPVIALKSGDQVV